ncbi:SMP-30/gluconolactonase/LRE family protein [uncultured Friedmanniella sp.]|uniref:SMP-30/gluconolactonase/LRE family protein n=1 Tax=uncultured Friedmanniella sp. TaxID=335381 RepID=UPI0035C98C1E
MSGLLESGAQLEKVATGTTWAEGPVWIPERRAVRYSDIPGDRIMEFSEPTGESSVYRHPAGFTNGRTRDPDGSVVQCSHGHRAVEREVDGVVSTLVDSWRGSRLNSPNDVVIASDGAIWFSDPAYGIKKEGEGHAGEEEYGDRYVFRFEPATGRLDPVVTDLEEPNGLAFSPDESLLYVSDTSREPPGPPHVSQPFGHAIHVYDVVDGCHAKNGRTLVVVEPGLPDGFRVDQYGNLWSSSGDAVQVFSPRGELLERVPVPEVIANVCFGGEDGQTLYIAASTSLYRIRTTVTDAVSRRPRPRPELDARS